MKTNHVDPSFGTLDILPGSIELFAVFVFDLSCLFVSAIRGRSVCKSAFFTGVEHCVKSDEEGFRRRVDL